MIYFTVTKGTHFRIDIENKNKIFWSILYSSDKKLLNTKQHE